MRWPAPAFTALLLAFAAAAAAADPAPALRVGTSGDYAPFSTAGPGEGELGGFDVAVARAYAEERGLALEFVRFRWGDLAEALAAGRFDVAMSGVTVRPDRSTAGRFTVPVATTGAVVLARQPERWKTVEEIDRPGVRIGVNAGGHLERVALERFQRAIVVSIRENDAVRRALLELDLHGAVTDTLEAPLWRGESEELVVLGPFTRDRKAYLVRSDRPDLAASLDAWLLARESDGTLGRLRHQYLGGAKMAATATPLGSLLAAIDERLALMPAVGIAKRRSGLPLEVPEREERVLAAAVTDARAAALRRGGPAPSEADVRLLFRAQLEAAKKVQLAAVRDPGFEPPEPLPDVESELRPALLRIGERIARLLGTLPRDLDKSQVRRDARDALRAPYLSPASIDAIADAITAATRSE